MGDAVLVWNGSAFADEGVIVALAPTINGVLYQYEVDRNIGSNVAISNHETQLRLDN